MSLQNFVQSNVGSTIVYAGEEYFITWNGHNTFNLVGPDGQDFDCFSVCGEVQSVECAIFVATKHAAEQDALSCIVCGDKSDEVPFDDESHKCISCLHEEEEEEEYHA